MAVLAIRLDDITPDMNWDNFDKIKSIFDQYDIKPLLGIVPDNQDPHLKYGEVRPDFWDYMLTLEKQGWTLAQHGYQHVYETKESGILGINPFSEFAGLPYDEQFEKLRKGQEILQNNGIYATVFMAPGHTYDDATRLALQQMKFQYVTDGYCDRPYEWDDIGYLPCTLSEPKIPKYFDTLCLHINDMSEEYMNQLDHFLSENEEYVISYAELLRPEYFAPRTGWVKRIEKKRLKKQRKRKARAGNPIMHAYLNRTYHENKWMKMLRRLIGLPRLAIEMLLSKNE